MTYSRSRYLVVTIDYVIPLLIFVGCLTLLYLTFFSSFFKVKTVICTQDFEPCSNPFILAEAQGLIGQNIFLLNSNNFIELLTAGDFQTRSGEIIKKLPTQLTLSLQSVYPVLALHVVGESRFATLDSTLSVIRLIESNPNVPIVELDSPISLQIAHPVTDESLSEVLRFAQNIIREIPGISKIRRSGDDLILTLADDLVLTLTIHRSVELQISALKAILGDATIREGLRKVDVRFAQPVLIKD